MISAWLRTTPALLPMPDLEDILRSGHWRPVSMAVLAAAGYYAGAKLEFALKFKRHPISVLWPPNSILLAALLLVPRRSWWFVLLVVFPVHVLAELQDGVPLKMILCCFVSNGSEALIAAPLAQAGYK